MKETKKILPFILCLVMIFSVFSPFVFAAETENVITYEYVAEPERMQSVIIAEESSEDIEWKAVFEYVNGCIKNHQSEIDISGYDIPNTTANKDTLRNFMYYYPANVRSISSFSFVNTSKRITGFVPTYRYESDALKNMIETTRDVVLSFTYDIKNDLSLTDAEKCLLIHDRLAAWCGYDYASYLTGLENIPEESYSAYGALVLKTAVCEGISLAYNWMMDELGIESRYETSDALGHGWNMVHIDGEAYYIDVTNDDPVWDRMGRVQHDNLLLSYSAFSANHKNATDFSDEPDSTVYESAFWTDSGMYSSEVQYADGKFYYAGILSGTRGIICRDEKSGEESIIKAIQDKWTAPSGNAYTQRYICLELIGDKLIYNIPSQIRSYDIITGEDTLVFAPDLTDYDTNTQIFGMTQRDGIIYYWLNTKPNYSPELPGTFLTYEYCTEHKNTELLEIYETATCTKEGTKKYVCKDCAAIFTETYIEPHCFDIYAGVKKQESCTNDRVDIYECVCGLSRDVTVKNTKTPHNYNIFIDVKIPATCTTDRVDTYMCFCGEIDDITIKDTKTAHTDNDGDGICDVCKQNIREAACSCACHKTGFSAFFFKVKILFSKIFNIEKNRYCSCGKAHW